MKEERSVLQCLWIRWLVSRGVRLVCRRSWCLGQLAKTPGPGCTHTPSVARLFLPAGRPAVGGPCPYHGRQASSIDRGTSARPRRRWWADRAFHGPVGLPMAAAAAATTPPLHTTQASLLVGRRPRHGA